MSDPANNIKTLFMHPQTDPMKEARRHLAIIEVGAAQIIDLLGFPPDFKFKDAEFVGGKLRIKLQHPSFPIKQEGECIVIIPLLHKDYP